MSVRPPALLSLLLAGCVSFDPARRGEWVEAEVGAPTASVVYEMSRESLVRRGFPIGSSWDPTSGEIRSEWRTTLHPFQGEGHRERAHLEIEPVEDGAGRWTVAVRVERDTNEELVQPLEPHAAEWRSAPDDVEEARILLQHLESRLGLDVERGGAGAAPWKSGGSG